VRLVEALDVFGSGHERDSGKIEWAGYFDRLLRRGVKSLEQFSRHASVIRELSSLPWRRGTGRICFAMELEVAEASAVGLRQRDGNVADEYVLFLRIVAVARSVRGVAVALAAEAGIQERISENGSVKGVEVCVRCGLRRQCRLQGEG